MGKQEPHEVQKNVSKTWNNRVHQYRLGGNSGKQPSRKGPTSPIRQQAGHETAVSPSNILECIS